MDLSLTPALREFRDEVRTWFAEHLVGEFARHRGVGFSWDDAAWDVRVAWDKELSAGGWLCIGWPRKYGGRGASVDEQLVFQLEYARANPPYRATAFGAGSARAYAAGVRVTRAEAPVPAADRPGRGLLGPGLQRTRRRVGPGRLAHPGVPGR